MTTEEKTVHEKCKKKMKEKELIEIEEDDKEELETEEQHNDNSEKTIQEEETEEQSENETKISDADVNINMEQSYSNLTSAMAILNIIKNLPRKNCNLRCTLFLISQKLEKCSNEEKLDVLLVLAHFHTEDVQIVLKENGTEMINIP